VLLRFVNAVAEEIEKQYPNILVETLAYGPTRQAPRVTRPRRNVLMRLCSIECDFGHPVGSGEHNRSFREDLEAWSAISPQLFIWHYVCNYGDPLFPNPNLHTLAGDIRTFVASKAIGLFEQGDGGSYCGDLVELRAWLLAHLMWDPSRDEQALIREFLRGYYGAAAEPLQEYLDLRTLGPERGGAVLFSDREERWPEDVARAGELFDRAAELVREDPVLSARVRRARLPVDYAWLQWAVELPRKAQLRGEPVPVMQDVAARVEDFITTVEGFGDTVGELAARLRALAGRREALAPPEVTGRSWFDVQEEEMKLVEGLAERVEDPSASNGLSVRMPGSIWSWALQYWFPGSLVELGPWHVWAVVRVEALAETGPALQIGIYDYVRPDDPAHTQSYLKSIEDLPGAGWHTVDLGVHALTGENYVWVAPCKNPEAVEAVYVDRFFFAREVAQ